MKVSVIIPSYKPGNYISKCLSSVLAQDFPTADYEMVIVLNGCLEPYKTMIEEVVATQRGAQEFPTVRILHTEQAGVSHARNLGIEAAQGENLVFIDDDDYISKNYLSELCALVTPDTVVASNAKNSIDEKGQTQDNFITRAFEDVYKKNLTTLYACRRLLSTVWGKIIPRQIVGEARFRENLSLGEDSVFMAEISKRIKVVKQTSPDVYYYVTVRPNSASRREISNWTQITNALELAWTFLKLYFTDIRAYNIPFFLSRVVASLLKMLSKKFRSA